MKPLTKKVMEAGAVSWNQRIAKLEGSLGRVRFRKESFLHL